MKVFEPAVPYGALQISGGFDIIQTIKDGVLYQQFSKFADSSPFTFAEWSKYLHLSERTLQRYETEKKKFDISQSEKIVEIVLLYKRGLEIFGSKDKFNSWLATPNLYLKKMAPKDLLDTSFGITILKDELTRIEYGILS
ncbi:MAG: DUF2384 domain-containing protein [Crocinitomicaceae bacterium]|nr:DUF2384 domain-containing protein [Crocinitomicaceae bacterium]MBK8925760.1 DUF2384 domain-containing protein [Crocinitomicaceae bacterium]